MSTGTSSAQLDTGILWAIMVDANRNVYTMNGYGAPHTLFKSTNGGMDFVNLFDTPQYTTKPDNGGTFEQGGFVRSFDISRAEPNHIVVAFHEHCYGDVAIGSTQALADGAVMCLAESRDGGETWHIYEGPVTATAADGGAPLILGTDALVYADPTGAYFIDDHARGKSEWSTVLTWEQSWGFNAINSNGAAFDADGRVYLGADNGLWFSDPDDDFGRKWTKVPNWPFSIVVATDGQSLFTSVKRDNETRKVHTAPLDDLAAFAPMNTPEGWNGVSSFAYDPVHHILYGAAGNHGLWRVVTH